MRLPADFDPLEPGETDDFTIDFVDDLKTGEHITSATVRCYVAEESQMADPDVSTRVVGPAFVSGSMVTQKVGMGPLAGVLYGLEATVTTDQSNTLQLWAHVPCVEAT